METNKPFWLLAITPWALSLLLVIVATRCPAQVESWYAQSLYPFLICPASQLVSYLPFALGEILLYALIILMLGLLIRHLFFYPRAISHHRWLKTMALVGLLYLTFLLIWGLNYYRLTWGEIAKLNLAPPQETEIIQLTQNLTAEVNRWRSQIDDTTLRSLTHDRRSLLAKAAWGYTKASDQYPVLGGEWGLPKPLRLSRMQTWAGISGYYMPFTAEPNVNQELPLPFYPSAALHEMAHLHGFAREDEANYLAYLTSQYHPDPLFKYSGTLLAWIYAADSLNQINPQAYNEVINSLSADVKQDLQQNHAFWSHYQGPLSTISERINDIYLKANHQQQGTISYNRIVELLVAQQRSKKVE
ncbi:MAG: DUF3810 domain-containing protein [Methylocystaceae bacterium]